MGGRRSHAQHPAWEPGHQERWQRLQGAELAEGDFLTASSGNHYDFNSQFYKPGLKRL